MYLADPQTPPALLQEIAAEYPQYWDQVLRHPNAYPELITWIRQHKTLNVANADTAAVAAPSLAEPPGSIRAGTALPYSAVPATAPERKKKSRKGLVIGLSAGAAVVAVVVASIIGVQYVQEQGRLNAISAVEEVTADQESGVGPSEDVISNLDSLSCERVGEIASIFTEGLYLNGSEVASGVVDGDTLHCIWHDTPQEEIIFLNGEKTNLDVSIHILYTDRGQNYVDQLCSSPGFTTSDYGTSFFSDLNGCGGGSFWNPPEDPSTWSSTAWVSTGIALTCGMRTDCNVVVPEHFTDEQSFLTLRELTEYAYTGSY